MIQATKHIQLSQLVRVSGKEKGGEKLFPQLKTNPYPVASASDAMVSLVPSVFHSLLNNTS